MYAPRTSEEPQSSPAPTTLSCPSCGHDNPEKSKFCNQCGMPVHFRACEACEAVNDATADRCYKCNHPFTASVDPALSVVADAPPADPPHRSRVLIALVALLALVVLLFFAYQDAPLPIEPVVFASFSPAPPFAEPEALAIDAESDAKLTAYTHTASTKGKATTSKPPAKTRKQPTPPSKPKPVRSIRAP